jgi:hypothetical protein
MFRCWILCLTIATTWAAPGVAMSATLEITATFDGRSGSSRQGFVDTTRMLAPCPGETCDGQGLLATPLSVTFRANPLVTSSDRGDRLFRWGISAAPRKLTMSNGSEAHPVELRIASLALTQSNTSAPWTFAEGSGTHGGCRMVSSVADSAVAWALPRSDTFCEVRVANDVQPTQFHVALGYDIVFPDAIRMANGIYRGEVRYGIGHGQDIDPVGGEANDAELVLRVTLTVEHEFRVDFGQGAGNPLMRVELEPPGGWGNTETNVVGKSMPFRVSAGGPFAMTLVCGMANGNGCGLTSKRAGTRTLYVDTVDIGGELRNNLSPAVPARFNAAARVLTQVPAAITFSSLAGDVGERYEGGITLIFEAQ